MKSYIQDKDIQNIGRGCWMRMKIDNARLWWLWKFLWREINSPQAQDVLRCTNVFIFLGKVGF